MFRGFLFGYFNLSCMACAALRQRGDDGPDMALKRWKNNKLQRGQRLELDIRWRPWSAIGTLFMVPPTQSNGRAKRAAGSYYRWRGRLYYAGERQLKCLHNPSGQLFSPRAGKPSVAGGYITG